MSAVQVWWALSCTVIAMLTLTEQFGALPGALAALGVAGYIVARAPDVR